MLNPRDPGLNYSWDEYICLGLSCTCSNTDNVPQMQTEREKQLKMPRQLLCSSLSHITICNIRVLSLYSYPGRSCHLQHKLLIQM